MACAKLAGIENTTLAPQSDAAADTRNAVDVMPDSCAPSCLTFASCKALHEQFPTAPSGVYSINAGSNGNTGGFSAYCEQVGDGGGWTLALKIDGRATTFGYDAAIWTSSTLLNPTSPALVDTEAKLQTFNAISFTQIRVGLEFPIGSGTVRYAVLPVSASNLAALFMGPAVTTTLGRAAWKALMGSSASLQANCNLEGINVGNTYSRVRIGIVANQEADCASPDSRIGIGGADAAQCGFSTSEIAGDTACFTADNGDGVQAAFGFVLVR